MLLTEVVLRIDSIRFRNFKTQKSTLLSHFFFFVYLFLEIVSVGNNKTVANTNMDCHHSLLTIVHCEGHFEGQKGCFDIDYSEIE